MTALNIVPVEGGDVLHAMKSIDNGYDGFGEAYFSKAIEGMVKAWKSHKKMTLNLVVPVGNVRFVMFDDREGSRTYNSWQKEIIGEENYKRLTIPPKIWFGFCGINPGLNLVLNIADIIHNPNEVERRDQEAFDYDWSL